MQPYNTGEALASTLEPAVALVWHNGTVYWSRPGILDVLCKFRGLNSFPFHHSLHCPIDVGGWLLSGTFQGISLLNGGYEFELPGDYSDQSAAMYDSEEGSEESAGSSYSQWRVGNMSASLTARTYPCCPEEPWPVITYGVTLARSPQFFFTYFLLMPSVLLAVLALLACFLSPEGGERLGFGVTLLLA